RAFHVEEDDVRLHFAQIDLDAGQLRDRFGEITRVGVIFVQARRRFFQRDEAGRSKDTDLPHAPAKKFAVDARLFDELARADQHRANRGAQSLGEAKHYGIEFARDVGHAAPEIDGSIEDARAIEV